MASDVLCLCIMLAAADLFLGFATSFQQVYALAQCDVYCSNYVTQAMQRFAVECGGVPLQTRLPRQVLHYLQLLPPLFHEWFIIVVLSAIILVFHRLRLQMYVHE